MADPDFAALMTMPAATADPYAYTARSPPAKSKSIRKRNPSGKSKKQKEVTVAISTIAHLDVPTVTARCEIKLV
ncbi:TPA: hypothetical protein ACH3X2_009607 [Trebouxia sp. C0005]